MRSVFKYYIRVIILSLPIFFLPVMIDAYGVGKNWWLAAGALLGLGLWIGSMMADKKNEVVINPAIVWMAIGTVWAVINWLQLPPGVRMNSVMNPMGVGTMAAMLIWVFLWSQEENDEERRIQWKWLTAAAVVVAITSLAAFFIPNSKLPFNWPKDEAIISIGNGWSLAGSVFGELVLMAVVASEWIRRLVKKLKLNQDYWAEAALSAVVMLAIFLDVYKIIKLGWLTIDGGSAWVMAVESFKRSPIWGVGVGNYVEAFNLFKPSSFNMTSLWGNVFSGANMGILQIWTELGIVGLAVAVVGGWMMIKNPRKNADYWRLMILLISFALLPLNLMAVILAGWLAAGVGAGRKWKMVLNVGEKEFNVAPYLGGMAVVAIMVFGGWWLVRILTGEAAMRKSLVMAAKNDGAQTYNFQIKAIDNNPYAAEYRRLYSQTNVALASTLLQNKEASDEDKEKASVLIQQAVREAKAAIALDGKNPVYWTNLASIYRSLVGLIEGSADWSLQAYQQASAYDPVNPMIKIEMGGLLFAAGNYEQADRVFEETVANKPNLANGWYNWAHNAKKMNRLADAVQRLSQAVALVPVDSGDYEKAEKELEEWKKEYEAAVAAAKAAEVQEPKEAETLKTAQPLPTMAKDEKVDLPTEDLEPPAIPTAVPTTTP